MKPGSTSWLPFLKPTRLLVLLGGTVLGATLVSVALPWPLRLLLDQAISPFPTRAVAWLPLVGTVGAYLALGWSRAFLFSRRHIFTERLAENFGRLLSRTLFTRLTSTSPAAVRRLVQGDVVVRLIEDVEKLKQVLVELIEGCVAEALILVGAAAAMFLVDWKFSLLVMGSLLPLYFGFTAFLPLLREGNCALRSLDGKRMGFIQEVTRYLETVKAFGRGSHEARSYSRILRDRSCKRSRLAREEGSFFLWNEGLASLSVGMVFAYGGWRVSQNTLTLGQVILFFQYAALLQGPVSRVAHFTNVLERARASAFRLREILTLPLEDSGTSTRPALGSPFSLTLSGLSFAHDGTQPIFSRVNLVLRSGDRVALVGPSGSGKTSLLKLLLQFHQPTEGSILIDGTNLSTLSPSLWRRSIAYVSQEPTLFSRSIQANLRYGVDTPVNPLKEEALIRDMDLGDLMERLPAGAATTLGEDGLALSGGEKQRLTLIRALLREAPILVMDEPTSSVDLKCENAVAEALMHRMKSPDKLTVFVTHRPSLLRLATRVIEVREGRLFELGPTYQEKKHVL